MVEAMFERSPNYFKQFRKKFKFLIVEEKPTFSIGNCYAVCAHFDSEFCNLVSSHYHVLIDTTTLKTKHCNDFKAFLALCLYSFQVLVLDCTKFGDKWRCVFKA